MKKKFAILLPLLLWASAAFGQVFTTLYLPTAGSGLTLNLAAGRAFCGGSVVTYAGGTLTMAASVTNRVYLNTASSCAPAVKSTAFTSSDIPIATVVTSGSAITSVVDARTMFSQAPSGFSNPMTTLGDMIVGGSSGTPQRLPVGSDGQVATADHTATNGIKWATPATFPQLLDSDSLVIWAGPDSTIGDDGGDYRHGTQIPMVGWSRTGSVCTAQSSSPYTWTLNQWFSTDQMGSAFTPPSPYAPWTTGYDLFQVASIIDSTHWTFNCPLITASSGTGGSAENANYFLPFLTASLPFFKNATPEVVLPTGSTVVSMAANYSTTIHPLITSWLSGHPGATVLVELTGGRNDMQACTANSTLKADLLSVAASIHADGASVSMSTLTPNPWNTTNLGCHLAFYNANDLNNWVKAQLPSNTTTAPNCSTNCGKFFDRVIDVDGVINNLNSTYWYDSNGLTSAGIATYAHMLNDYTATQTSIYTGYPDNIGSGPVGGSLSPGFGVTHYATSTGKFAETWWTNDGNGLLFGIDANSGPYFPNVTNTGCIGTNSQGYPAGTNCIIGWPSSGVAASTGSAWRAPVYGDIVALFGGGTCTSGYLAWNGTCSNPSPLSGMTAGQVPIAATGSTVTSSKPLAGPGAAITTGPATSVSGDIANFTGTAGQIADSGIASANVALLNAANVFTQTQTMPNIVAPASSSATDSASLGPELTTSGTCAGTGWTGTYPNYTAPGTTAPLTCTGFTSGNFYQTVTGITGNTGAGTVTVVIGTAQVSTSSSAATSSLTFSPEADGASLTYTPTAAFNGTLNISAKQILPITTWSYTGKDSTGAVSTQFLRQTLASLYNDFGEGSGSYCTTCSNNTNSGYAGQYSLTTGINNTNSGTLGQQSLTTGSGNTNSGLYGQYSLTTGSSNTDSGYAGQSSLTTGNYNSNSGAQGQQSLTTGYNNTNSGFEGQYSLTTGSGNTNSGTLGQYSLTTGSSNTNSGLYGQYSLTTGYSNTSSGYQAGRFTSGGTSPNQTSSNSLYDGANTEPLADGDTNENVIGNRAVGHGSNTTTLGDSSITDTYLAGNVHAAISVTTPTVTVSGNTYLVGAAPASGTNCLQITAGGIISNTGSACGTGGSGAVSGQANGVVPLATASTVIGAQSHLSDNGTTMSFSEPVGIETTSPAGQFDIANKVHLYSSGSSGNDGNGVFFTPDTYTSGLYTGASGALLDYAINSDTIDGRNDAAVGGFFRMDTRPGSITTGAQSFAIYGIPVGTTSETLMLAASLQDGTTLLVPVEGNVGIGSTAPSSKLTVKGGDAFIDGTATGVILRDTVVTTNCYRITIASGLVVPTLVTCPTD